MKALANPVRLRIVRELSHGERCLCELLPRFRLDKSTLSRRVAELRRASLIEERREGCAASSGGERRASPKLFPV